MSRLELGSPERAVQGSTAGMISGLPPRTCWQVPAPGELNRRGRGLTNKTRGRVGVLVRPIIASWEVPRIARIASGESRRISFLPVPGLIGDLSQDLGRGALVVEISGALYGDEARDDFLKQLRQSFLAGTQVDFVADIVNEYVFEMDL